MKRTLIDADGPPADRSLAVAYWCDMDYFLAHTASGAHPPCQCPKAEGHNDPLYAKKAAAFLGGAT